MTYFHTRDLPAARDLYLDDGGWLLDLGDGHYLVTDDEGLVWDLRGAAFVAACQAAQCWDETDEHCPTPAE